MQLHQIQPRHKNENKKRIARGGKRGTYSGRGQKGQSSRAGAKFLPAERVLIIRIPKRRGFKNKPLAPKPIILKLNDLEKKFDNNQTINIKVLLEKGFIKNENQRVKILDGGEVKKTFEIEGLEVSVKAAEKIKSAGGKIK
ncbi:MAG: 50S ribosomal protein L15 [bacterium]|nr:50S ribosomal protein L15 [bacterium]